MPPEHRDVIHSASAIHSLDRFYVLRKFVLIRSAPVLLLPFLGFVCYEKETDSHVGLPDLLGMTGISEKFVGRAACPRRFRGLYVAKKRNGLPRFPFEGKHGKIGRELDLDG